MAQGPSSEAAQPSRGRMFAGLAAVVIGQLFSVFVPAIQQSGLSDQVKGFLSGAMFFVLPDLCFMAAVVIWGKAGFERIKRVVYGWLGRVAPSGSVGRPRHRLGLAMVGLPVLYAWVSPYLGTEPGGSIVTTASAIGGDVMLLAGFFVLGGDFWDKFRGLFVYGAVVRFPQV